MVGKHFSIKDQYLLEVICTFRELSKLKRIQVAFFQAAVAEVIQQNLYSVSTDLFSLSVQLNLYKEEKLSIKHTMKKQLKKHILNELQSCYQPNIISILSNKSQQEKNGLNDRTVPETVVVNYCSRPEKKTERILLFPCPQCYIQRHLCRVKTLHKDPIRMSNFRNAR